MSIGKSSLARAAAAAGARPMPGAEAAPVITGLQQVETQAITAVSGDKLPVRTDPELVRSIVANGLIEPLILAQTTSDTLVLIAGARRLAAAKKVGLTTVPAIIQELSADEAVARRREIKRFATLTAKTAKEAETIPAGTTVVGQAMPDWLL